MMNSRQIFSTGRQTVASLGKSTFAIDVTVQNAFFVCMGINIADTLGGSNLQFWDLVLAKTNDRLSKNPISIHGYINMSGVYQDAGGYTRANGRPHFIVAGGDKMLVTFYNNDNANAVYMSAAFTGYFIDGSGRMVQDIANIPAAVQAKN